MAEKDYYVPIKKELEKLLSSKGQIHLEITANKVYSNKLKEQIDADREMVFHFLKEAVPDILGFIKTTILENIYFVVIEVKDEVLKLDDVYQARKYAELFNVTYAFLVSTKEIPEELKRLSKIVEPLLSIPEGQLVLAQFDPATNQFIAWHKQNPFDSDNAFF
jgi:hypothetical protein